MRTTTKFFLVLGIMLPVIFSSLVVLSPMDLDLANYSRQSRQAYLDNDLFREAEGLQQILEYRPWQGELWQRLGRLLLTSGKSMEAAAAFQKAKDQGSLDPQGMVWMADAMIALGKDGQAIELLRSVSAECDVQLCLQAAALQRKINDLSGEQSTLRRAYAQDPSNVILNYQLGLMAASQDPENAIAHLEIAKTNPSYQALSENLINLINQTNAIAGTAERLIYIGQTLSQAGEWYPALNAFLNATSIDDQNAAAWALTGESQQQLGMDGYSALEKARVLAPENELVNGLLGVYYQRQKKGQVALFYFEKAVNANPLTSVWEIEIANTLASIGELEKAREHYHKAILINEQDWTAWKALAVFCLTHNYEIETTGINAARQALVLNPDSPVLLDLMGTLFMAVGDLDSAERFYLQADKLDPDQAAILIHLGQLLIQKGDKQSAFAYLKRAAESAEEGRVREMALRLIYENGGN